MSNVTDNELLCQQLVETITDYLDGAMSGPEREQFEQHLAGCLKCRAYVSQMQQTIRLAGRLGAEVIPSPAKAELLTLFRNWKAAEHDRPPADSPTTG